MTQNAENINKFWKKFHEAVVDYGVVESRAIWYVNWAQKLTTSFKGNSIPGRGTVLQRLALMTLTENERMMHDKGFKTRLQVMEESFWYRVAYHGYREFGP